MDLETQVWTSLVVLMMIFSRALPHVPREGAKDNNVEDMGDDDYDYDDWGYGDDENAFRNRDFIGDRDHIQHHFGNDFDLGLKDAEDEELEFHFFKLHDLNDDNKLDGLEILSALRHGAHKQEDRIMKRTMTPPERKIRMDRFNQKLVKTVDTILSEDDEDGDGYLTYWEYARSRRATVELGKALGEEAETDPSPLP